MKSRNHKIKIAAAAFCAIFLVGVRNSFALELPSSVQVNSVASGELCDTPVTATVNFGNGYPQNIWATNVTGCEGGAVEFSGGTGYVSCFDGNGEPCGSQSFSWPPDVCGDGYKTGSETCDDDNNSSGDGCSSLCAVESGFSCNGATPDVCASDCGNGVINENEACDDGNNTAGDGCSVSCDVEEGWTCNGEPSACVENTEPEPPASVVEWLTLEGKKNLVIWLCVAAFVIVGFLIP